MSAHFDTSTSAPEDGANSIDSSTSIPVKVEEALSTSRQASIAGSIHTSTTIRATSDCGSTISSTDEHGQESFDTYRLKVQQLGYDAGYGVLSRNIA